MTTTIKEHYKNEDVARSYDRERFRGLVGRTFDRLEKRTLRKALDLVCRQVPEPRALDVPCGTGRITELLLEQGLDVIGGDISPAMMEVAREKTVRFGERVSYLQLDLDRLDLPDGSFDLVTCIRLFHHLQTAAREKILRELARVTRRFVVVNVSLSSPYHRLRRRVKRLLGQGVSTTSSTWAEIHRETQAAGLRIDKHFFVLRAVSEDLVLVLAKK